MRGWSLTAPLVAGLCVSVALASGYALWEHAVRRAPVLPAVAVVPVREAPLPPTGMEPALLTSAPRTVRPDFRLSGIVMGPGEPVAVINDRIFHLGDTVDDMQVTTITPSTVTLQRDTTSITLRLRD